MERHGGELARLARNLARRVPDLPEPQSPDPETERNLLFSAAAGLLERVAQSVPVYVVLDDLHRADGQSVALLKHVVRTVKQGCLQVIATYRDSDLGKDHPLSAGGRGAGHPRRRRLCARAGSPHTRAGARPRLRRDRSAGSRARRSAGGGTGLTATVNNGALPPRFDGQVAPVSAETDAVAHAQGDSE